MNTKKRSRFGSIRWELMLFTVLLCAVLLGATIDHFLPHVHSLPEALRMIQGR